MKKRMMIAGFGGQGIMLIGQLLGHVSCDAGLQVCYYPCYGTEQRGGTANCTVIVSDAPIGSPNVEEYDYMILMNQPSCEKFAHRLAADGTMFVNSDLVEPNLKYRDRARAVAALSKAIEIGSATVANMVMLGFFIELTELLPFDNVVEMVKKKLSKKNEFEEINRRALETGRTLAAILE